MPLPIRLYPEKGPAQSSVQKARHIDILRTLDLEQMAEAPPPKRTRFSGLPPSSSLPTEVDTQAPIELLPVSVPGVLDAKCHTEQLKQQLKAISELRHAYQVRSQSKHSL